MSVGLEHIGIEVPNFEAVRRFYQDVLGLKVLSERELPPGAQWRRLMFMEGPGVKLEFFDAPEVKVVQSFHLAFQVDSVSKIVETLKAQGLEQVMPIRAAARRPEGVDWFMTFFLGPAGERLEFMGPE